MRSRQTQLAAAMAALAVLPGLLCFYVSYRAFTDTDDMLLIVMPIIGSAAFVGGFVLVGGALSVSLGLLAGKPGARLQALVGGVCVAFGGLFALGAEPLVGLLLILYGGTLAYLVLRPGAGAELGSFRELVPRQPAPWGQTPGAGLWSQEPVQQGPWSPPPTSLPFLPWKQPSGPRTPWWELWRAGLSQGIPLWELCLLVPALLAVVAGNVLVLLGLRGTAYLGTLRLQGTGALVGLLLLGAGIGVVAWLEKRMRRRLQGSVARH